MKVVSDASPLISLARIGHFGLLHNLYGTIVIPTEIYHEVVIAGAGLPGARQAAGANWIQVTAVSNPTALRVAVEETGLGTGEVSAVILAKELAADLLLVDEWKARRYAVAEGLSVKGCIGILESFHRRGLLHDLRGAYIRLLAERIRVNLQALQDS